MTSKITPETYVLKFGKYKNMRAVDVAQIYEVDKDGNYVGKGLKYLSWLCDQDWFKHKDIVEKIIKSHNSVDADAKPEQEPKKKDKIKKGTVRITTNETLDLH